MHYAYGRIELAGKSAGDYAPAIRHCYRQSPPNRLRHRARSAGWLIQGKLEPLWQGPIQPTEPSAQCPPNADVTIQLRSLSDPNVPTAWDQGPDQLPAGLAGLGFDERKACMETRKGPLETEFVVLDNGCRSENAAQVGRPLSRWTLFKLWLHTICDHLLPGAACQTQYDTGSPDYGPTPARPPDTLRPTVMVAAFTPSGSIAHV
ncbi:hypothetical protein VDGL01_01254 [Verticillium dahliae]